MLVNESSFFSLTWDEGKLCPRNWLVFIHLQWNDWDFIHKFQHLIFPWGGGGKALCKQQKNTLHQVLVTQRRSQLIAMLVVIFRGLNIYWAKCCLGTGGWVCFFLCARPAICFCSHNFIYAIQYANTEFHNSK